MSVLNNSGAVRGKRTRAKVGKNASDIAFGMGNPVNEKFTVAQKMDIHAKNGYPMDIQWISISHLGAPARDIHQYPWISISIHGYPWTVHFKKLWIFMDIQWIS